MKVTIEISADEFEQKFKKLIPLKSSKENRFYGKAKDGSFIFRSSERTDTLIKGSYVDVKDGCELNYDFSKPLFDKFFWAIYIAITAFFALALLSKYSLFSLLSALIMVFGIVCMLIKPKKFQKNLETSFTALLVNSQSEEASDELEETPSEEKKEEAEEKAEKAEGRDDNNEE